MPSTRCCRSCPRCDDCPALLALAARGRRAQESALAALVSEVLIGRGPRELPVPVSATLEALDRARRGEPVGAGV